jgi:hypothetical protein
MRETIEGIVLCIIVIVVGTLQLIEAWVYNR